MFVFKCDDDLTYLKDILLFVDKLLNFKAIIPILLAADDASL